MSFFYLNQWSWSYGSDWIDRFMIWQRNGFDQWKSRYMSSKDPQRTSENSRIVRTSRSQELKSYQNTLKSFCHRWKVRERQFHFVKQCFNERNYSLHSLCTVKFTQGKIAVLKWWRLEKLLITLQESVEFVFWGASNGLVLTNPFN